MNKKCNKSMTKLTFKQNGNYSRVVNFFIKLNSKKGVIHKKSKLTILTVRL